MIHLYTFQYNLDPICQDNSPVNEFWVFPGNRFDDIFAAIGVFQKK